MLNHRHLSDWCVDNSIFTLVGHLGALSLSVAPTMVAPVKQILRRIKASFQSPYAREVLRRYPGLVVGLVMFAFGIALQVKSTLGLAPWEALHQGMSIHTPLSIGISGILTGVIVLVLWIPLHQRLGIGTVSNVIVIGLVIDGSLWLLGDISNVYLHWLYMLGGITLTGLGSGIYIGARLGPGPRDGLMTGLAERGISIRLARFFIEGVVLVGGWLLGGTIGIGTVAFTLLIGPIVQFFLERFDRGEITAERASSMPRRPRRS